MHTTFGAVLLSGPYLEHLLGFVLVLLMPIVAFAVATWRAHTSRNSPPSGGQDEDRQRDELASEG
jgi:hypothetical protein